MLMPKRVKFRKQMRGRMTGMAKGGSGDALTGVAGALIAQGLEPGVAAYFASELHGLAGEAAQEEFGERGMLATDLIEMLSEVML